MTTMTIKKPFNVKSVVLDYLIYQSEYGDDLSPLEYFNDRIINALWDAGGGKISKKSYKKLSKKFLKLIDEQKKK